METKRIERVNYDYIYVATDGTEFYSEDECRAYEQSAKGVLKTRLKKFALSVSTECDLFNGSGSDENTTYVVVPKSEAEVQVIHQLIHLMSYGDKERQTERVEVGKLVIVMIGYQDDGLWVTDFNEIVSKATEGAYEIVEKKEKK